MKLDGIHHITAITGDAPANVEFYTGVLGLRLVKKSVNQDDPTVYHLFYGDEDGVLRAIRHARIRLADEGHFELVLGLQMSRFIPAYRLPDKTLVDQNSASPPVPYIALEPLQPKPAGSAK